MEMVRDGRRARNTQDQLICSQVSVISTTSLKPSPRSTFMASTNLLDSPIYSPRSPHLSQTSASREQTTSLTSPTLPNSKICVSLVGGHLNTVLKAATCHSHWNPFTASIQLLHYSLVPSLPISKCSKLMIA